MKTFIHLPKKISAPGVELAVREYLKRITDIPLALAAGLPRENPREELSVCLDLSGQQVTTEALHRWLLQKTRTTSTIRFLIGGKNGLEKARLRTADWRWSLGPLVLNQSIAALVVSEQLYRCYCLRTNHPYH